MSTPQSRWSRAKEWLWRGQRLRELRAHPPEAGIRRALDEARACHTLATRVLAGIEPISAATRDAVARPLLLTGFAKCLSPSAAGDASIDALFEEPRWSAALADAGLDDPARASLRQWLKGAPSSEPRDGQRALLALTSLLDARLAEQRAIARVLWRRVRLLSAALVVVAALGFGIFRLVAPPEGPDLAVGKPWHASSNYPGFAASGVKDQKPSDTAFFSTNDEASPWWIVDLGAPTLVGSVTVENRADCCPDRAIPFVVELGTNDRDFREVGRRTTPFRTWSATFAATPARYVRLRALRRTYLHFRDVRVHAPTGH